MRITLVRYSDPENPVEVFFSVRLGDVQYAMGEGPANSEAPTNNGDGKTEIMRRIIAEASPRWIDINNEHTYMSVQHAVVEINTSQLYELQLVAGSGRIPMPRRSFAYGRSSYY